jgi:2-polyprenyl-6-methoxyphenol hydroxylase-like FAD-dependent oxidoreductase
VTGRAVGVVGAGISGLALATLLARDGWDVTVLERSDDLGPVGAGFMLQRLGQQVAYRLGIGEVLRERSSPIRRVDGRTLAGRPTMQIRYGDVVTDPAVEVEGWGVERGTLFELLHAAAVGAGATVVPRAEVRVVRRSAQGWRTVGADGRDHGPFDLLVGADGASSQLRRLAFTPQMDREYGWGALWSVVPDPDRLVGDALVQRWVGTRTTLGLMPTGRGRVSVFWSVPVRDIDRALAAGPEALVRQALRVSGGEYAPLLEAMPQAGVLGARYRDVVVRQPAHDRAVLVGDAAHAMSPQLGIGASMGLADAWTLAWALGEQPGDLDAALRLYVRSRRRHLTYYRWWSMLMTPVFQSGLTPLGPPRDLGLAAMSRLPFAQRQMVTTLMGVRTSPWTRWSLPG